MKRLILIALLAAAEISGACAMARADWALAVGQDGSKRWNYGSSWNQTETSAARRKALANCEVHGPNCKVVLDGASGCVALAVGVDDNAWHAKQSATRREAAKSALDECVKSSSGDCEVKHTFCEE